MVVIFIPCLYNLIALSISQVLCMPIGYKRCVYVAYLQSDQPNPKPLLNEIAKLKELSNICNFQRLIKQFFKFGAV